ncbi:DUF2309 domain-containing protein [Prosthecobacter dejongeii]|uniref:Probable inorganic carbon transporter subunit DabA n=1 Tax=Prosthecobacter dejongeii TaxID=48465 RepID=A0A7W7YKS5_9BACT|nr:DUF2309 domain-containing protein [Prosthecobacter dejongeii]MBB5037755.1 hypothetical protein [Prosthecobacter dejongeii]
MSASPSSAPCDCHGHPAAPASGDVNEKLHHLLDHASHYLPAQGPIGVFIHHNTLHAFQHQPFEKAVLEAAHVFKTEPYMSEEAYQKERQRGRILDQDIDAAVKNEADAEIIPGRLTRRQLRRALLIPGVRRVNGRNIAWHVEEGEMLQAFRTDLDPLAARALATDSPQALWEVCTRRYKPQPAPALPRPKRPREAVMASRGVDLDLIVHPPLIRLTGAYLDQGIAYWPMPLREQGLLKAARQIIALPFSVYPAHLSRIGQVFSDQEKRGLEAEAVVNEMLVKLGVPEAEWQDYIIAELLPLAGWAGLVRCLEKDPSLAPHDRVRCSLMEFLALRLTYTAVALESVMGDTKSWRRLKAPVVSSDPLTHQARLYDAAQLLGLPSKDLQALPEGVFTGLCEELEACNELERRRLLHIAYERRHERQILIPLAKHRAMPRIGPDTCRLAAQVMFCIDEREESIRRALEEIDPSIETHGAAGFFGCAIDYTGIDDAHGVPLCPVVVKPAHEVREKPMDGHSATDAKRQSLRRVWAKVVRHGYISSRTLVRGSFSTAFLGFFSLFPMALRVLSPLSYARFMGKLNDIFLPEPRTELSFMRDDATSKDATSGLLLGFSTQEKADRVASVLGPAGLHKGHARLVVVLGHGSTSLNNPHESAHDCGACGGRRGGPNARVFAAMANRPEVRESLRAKGIVIPDDTWFIGGYHDTCNDNIDLYDLDAVPDSHRGDLASVRESLDKARAMSAHERARRFEAAGKGLDASGGLHHVQERAEHLGEPRPEYGHCTNAVTLVGRREATRGLFFDRRAFLVSYDATKDLENKALAAVLGAVIPVCGGISLEYYFSFVDNEGYGCGTKLPHNVTGLVGVMNGFQGDLRTGLPLQMVEIHEPVRILFVVETTPERVMSTILANPLLKEFLVNRWIRLATMDPEDGHIEIYRDGVFEKLEGDEEPLPVAASSMAYYSGKIEHLPVARIDPHLTHAA